MRATKTQKKLPFAGVTSAEPRLVGEVTEESD
jgi:hypothetical protein